MQNVAPKLNLAEHGTHIVCSECGNNTFEDVVFLFKVSKLITGTSQDSVVPVPTFKCSACGHINDEFTLKQSSPPTIKA